MQIVVIVIVIVVMVSHIVYHSSAVLSEVAEIKT